MCVGSIEQHDIEQLQLELEQEEAAKEYLKNYRVSFATFTLFAPSPVAGE